MFSLPSYSTFSPCHRMKSSGAVLNCIPGIEWKLKLNPICPLCFLPYPVLYNCVHVSAPFNPLALWPSLHNHHSVYSPTGTRTDGTSPIEHIHSLIQHTAALLGPLKINIVTKSDI